MLPSRAVAAVALALYVVDVEAGLGDPQSENRSATTKFKLTMHQAVVTDSPEKGESLLQDHSQLGHEDPPLLGRRNPDYGAKYAQTGTKYYNLSPSTVTHQELTKPDPPDGPEENSTSEERLGVFGHEGGPGPLFGKAKTAADTQFGVADSIAGKAKDVQQHMTDAATSLHHYHKDVLGLNENLQKLDTVQESVNPLFQYLRDRESETVEPVDDKRFEKYTSALAHAKEEIEERMNNDAEDE